MLSRRNVISAMALTPFATTLGINPGVASTTVTETPPDAAMAKLIEGNARHAKGEYSADNGTLLRDRTCSTHPRQALM